MKNISTIFLSSFFFFMSISFAFAQQCPEKEAIVAAIEKRRAKFSQVQEQYSLNPEDQRKALSGCLSSIQKLSAGFSLGAFMPDFEQITMKGMCKKLDDKIKEKLNKMQEALPAGDDLSFGSPGKFYVNIDFNDIANDLIGKIK